MAPQFIDVFLAPIRDNMIAQVGLIALFLLIVLDWVFGIGNALAKNEFSSKKMRIGIGHKCTELGFVLVGLISDAMLSSGFDLGFDGPIMITITLYLCIMEIGSLLETFVKMNPDLGNSPVFKLFATAHIVHIEEDEENDS